MGACRKILVVQSLSDCPGNGRRNLVITRTDAWRCKVHFCAGGKNFCAVRSGESHGPL